MPAHVFLKDYIDEATRQRNLGGDTSASMKARIISRYLVRAYPDLRDKLNSVFLDTVNVMEVAQANHPDIRPKLDGLEGKALLSAKAAHRRELIAASQPFLDAFKLCPHLLSRKQFTHEDPSAVFASQLGAFENQVAKDDGPVELVTFAGPDPTGLELVNAITRFDPRGYSVGHITKMANATERILLALYGDGWGKVIIDEEVRGNIEVLAIRNDEVAPRDIPYMRKGMEVFRQVYQFDSPIAAPETGSTSPGFDSSALAVAPERSASTKKSGASFTFG